MSRSEGTFDPSVRVDQADGKDVLRKRWVMYSLSSLLLSILLGLAIVDGAGIADIYGVDTAHVRSVGGGYELDVRYGTVSRPGIATPLEITVQRPGGFDGPVLVAVNAEYLSIWDENGLDPDPASATATERLVVWEFDPPQQGDTLVVSYDARIEPAAQQGKPGRIAVLDDVGQELVAVNFSTRVLP